MCNEGSAWGLIKNKEILILTSTCLLFLIGYVWYNTKNKIVRWSLALIFLGGSFNLWERIRNGCVVDYWKVFSWWPEFNFADSLIAIGLVVIVSTYFKDLIIKEKSETPNHKN